MTRTVPTRPPRTEESPRPAPESAWGDRALEVVTWLVAWWTLLYWAGWSLGTSLFPWAWVWLSTSLAAVVVLAVRSRRRHRRLPPGTATWTPSEMTGAARGRLRVLLVGVAVVAAVGVLPAALRWPEGGFRLLWLLPLVAMTAGLLVRLGPWRGLRRPAAAEPPPPGVTRLEHLAVVALGIGTAVLATLIRLPDSDDPYYVNRSTWIAAEGTAMVRDTLFGPGTYVSPYNGGIPIASVEALVGVLSGISGVSVGTLTWVVTTAVGALASVWAFWALARRWSPRLPLVVLLVAVAFLLLSGESRLGNFWIARMWQGKVLALTVLLPMIWVWVDDLVRHRDRRRWATLAAAGLAFVGLTSTAVILVPFVVGGMLVGALALRHRELAVGAVLLAVGPVLSGLAVVALSTGIGETGALRYGAETFRRVLGPDTWMVAVALVAMALAPLLLRSRSAALMAGSTVAATFVVLLPPLLELANDLTGSGPILWRVMYCVPVAVLVGLLAVWRPPGLGAVGQRVTAVVLPVALVGSFLLAGAGLWSTADHGGPPTLEPRPTWKVDLVALERVEAVLDTGVTGVVLLPPRAMGLMPMVTTQAYALDPRGWYTRILDEPAEVNEQRRLLARYAREETPRLTPADLATALRTLDVQLVCLQDDHFERERDRLAQAGWTDPERLSGLTCVAPPPG